MKSKLYRIEATDNHGAVIYDPCRMMACVVVAASIEDAIETFKKQAPEKNISGISDTGSEVMISDKSKQ